MKNNNTQNRDLMIIKKKLLNEDNQINRKFPKIKLKIPSKQNQYCHLSIKKI